MTSHIHSESAPSQVKLTTHHQYTAPRLLRENLNPDPLIQFNEWFTSALKPTDPSIPPVREPEAMAISTVSSSGIPSTRVVLLKTVDKHGFVFFTNYNSRKSRELANGYASLAIYWKEVSKQIRAVGRVEKVSREESEEYFRTRPRGSQLGAWASAQSTEVEDGDLEQKVQELDKKFEGDVPCPDFWGGWRIVPFEVEFWVGQPSRLHDRFRYTRPQDSNTNDWKIVRLSP